MTSDFSSHPPSITEIRAQKSQDCGEWTPRDALIELLRRIDAGEVRVDALVMAYREVCDGGKKTSFSLAAPDLATGLGLMVRGQWLMNEAGGS